MENTQQSIQIFRLILADKSTNEIAEITGVAPAKISGYRNLSRGKRAFKLLDGVEQANLIQLNEQSLSRRNRVSVSDMQAISMVYDFAEGKTLPRMSHQHQVTPKKILDTIEKALDQGLKGTLTSVQIAKAKSRLEEVRLRESTPKRITSNAKLTGAI